MRIRRLYSCTKINDVINSLKEPKTESKLTANEWVFEHANFVMQTLSSFIRVNYASVTFTFTFFCP